ncbi:hypothetical protein OIU84_027921 [Salix udensis]|uniref:Uncharacterized protein n=1 Tax=Salix udensis TaxID=889485 RepID=A0AAD6P7Z0_9ROSI|nr:hypothetical protein OIU84_027921 [Salix udensis]
MDIKVLVQEGAEIAQPFLENALQKPAKTPGQKAMRKTFKGTAHLARLLPTASGTGEGKVRYGMVTFKGLWIMDSPVELSPEEAAKYKLRFMDVLHAFMSILVFGAVSLFDKNVVKCFFPTPTDEAKDLLIAVPATIGSHLQHLVSCVS